MNEIIVTQVYSVLDKYDKQYSNSGVLYNLNKWEHNKSSLIELLRKHPNWNEDALAVIFEVTQSREIDRCVVREYNYNLSQLISDLDIAGEDAINLRYSLDNRYRNLCKIVARRTGCFKY